MRDSFRSKESRSLDVLRLCQWIGRRSERPSTHTIKEIVCRSFGEVTLLSSHLSQK